MPLPTWAWASNRWSHETAAQKRHVSKLLQLAQKPATKRRTMILMECKHSYSSLPRIRLAGLLARIVNNNDTCMRSPLRAWAHAGPARIDRESPPTPDQSMRNGRGHKFMIKLSGHTRTPLQQRKRSNSSSSSRPCARRQAIEPRAGVRACKKYDRHNS